MRLIDADEIKLPQGFFEKVDNVPKFYEWLDEQPTVDAIPVVRCEDCRWWKYEETEEDTLYGECCVDMYFGGVPTVGHHFCSNGERKEDETN